MEIAQILINTLVRAAELSLLAIGLTMVFDILKFANFAHTDYAVLGALIAYVFNRILGLNLVLAIILAAFVTGWVGILIDQTIFQHHVIGVVVGDDVTDAMDGLGQPALADHKGRAVGFL